MTWGRKMAASMLVFAMVAVTMVMTQQTGFLSGSQTQNLPLQGDWLVIQLELTITVTYIMVPVTSPVSQFVVSNPRELEQASTLANQRKRDQDAINQRFKQLGLDNLRSGSSSGLHTIFIGTKPTARELMEDSTLVDFLLQDIFRAMGMSQSQQAQNLQQMRVLVGSATSTPSSPGDSTFSTFRGITPTGPGDFLRVASTSTTSSFSPFSTSDFPTRSNSDLPSSSSSPQLACQRSTDVTCDPGARFRTADGTCNNLRQNLRGAAFTPFRRFLPPAYDDGVSNPRTLSRAGGLLPSARLVSNTVHPPGPGGEATALTNMVMQWGQFVDHDITSTAVQSAADGGGLTCCLDDIPPGSPPNLDVFNRTACFPITIPTNDPFFGGRHCLSFPRSVQVTNANCQQSPVEQLNQITSYVDGSQVYGSSEKEQKNLRTSRRGQLRTSREDLLPRDPNESCVRNSPRDYCFKAGDIRVNEQMALSSLHTVFLRHHNSLAQQLSRINPQWDDERLFQEARKIVGAQLQRITYGDWLPIVLDRTHLQRYRLPLMTSGLRDVYSPDADASIRNVFATAAFRFGHSQIRSTFSQLGTNYRDGGVLQLEQSFGNTSHILESGGEGVAMYVRGMLRDPPNKVDRIFTESVRDHLFMDRSGHSLDLVALNIQRGRDHGLPSYNTWRRFCGLNPVTFNSMTDHDPDTARRFPQVFRDPDDIDLFSGAISEQPQGQGLVGPTFGCLLAQQFSAIKFGDRFWFESSDPVTGFSRAQVEEIRKHGLSRILCDVTKIQTIQPDPFRQVNRRNPLMSCREMPEINLEPWREGGVRPDPSQTPQIPVVWSPWFQWSSCQFGQETRRRECSVQPPTGEVPCIGPLSEIRDCKREGFSEWGVWSPWSQCIQGTFQRRKRVCQGFGCQGTNREFRRCHWPDVAQTGWAPWGHWSSECQSGKQWRRRTCNRSPEVLGSCAGPSNESRDCGDAGSWPYIQWIPL